MGRELDTAVLDLGALGDRDAILDAFFAHARTLFEFSVFFVVKNDGAHGRSVSGLGAPQGLVTRLVVPLQGRGFLARAFEHREAFVASSPAAEEDLRLFGNLGRALPHPLVVPLVVRDRVVGIFVGETSADRIVKAAGEVGRPPLELARDEMGIWAESTGQVLERLILRRKKTADSMPPPANVDVSAPPPPATWGTPTLLAADAAVELERAPRDVRGPRWRVALVVLVAGAMLAAGAWVRLRPVPGRDAIYAAGRTLPGWPHGVDPLELLERARKASGLTGPSELGSIEAELTAAGKVDFEVPPQNIEALWLRYEFVSDDVKADVIVDSEGMHTGRMTPRDRCGDVSCRGTVPLPACTLSRLVEAARPAGLAAGEPVRFRYSASTRDPASTPEWLLTVAGRGSLRMDGRTCETLPRERLRPAARSLKDIPGSPQKVNPLEILALARNQSGLPDDAVLLEIDARGVTAGGFVDLTVPDAGISYIFGEPLGQPKRRWREVLVRSSGMPIASDDGDSSPVPARLAGAIPAPRCTFSQARENMTRGGTDAGLTHVTYGPDLAFQTTGVWTLESPNLASRRSMNDLECDTAMKRPVQRR